MSLRFPRLPLTALALAVLAGAVVRAEEGMWTFDNPPREAVKKAYGVDLTPTWLEHLRLSSVRLGGCSASFASPAGLILTNHHCVRSSCLEALSRPDRNTLVEGFYAETQPEEETCAGAMASVLVGTDDVTGAVQGAAQGLDAERANDARKAEMSRLEKACIESAEQAGEELHCEVKDLYRGGEYWLYRYKRYRDVRLVFAPEGSAAHFGGDPDNFDYPRYAFDMALIRAYENGKPAVTPHYLRWSATAARPGEAVFVTGHPGSTERLLTLEQLKTQRRFVLPLDLYKLSEERGRLQRWSAENAEHARLARPTLLGIDNNFKRQRGKLDALLDDRQLERKARAEQELRAAVKRDPRLEAEFGSAWDEMARLQESHRRLHSRYELVERSGASASRLYSAARALVRGAAERPKPNGERLREFTDAALPALEQTLLAPRPISPELEKLRLAMLLEKLREFLGPDDPAVREILGRESPESLAEALVAGTGLADAAKRKDLWQGGQGAIDASQDSMIRFAARIDLLARKLRKEWETAVEAPTTRQAERIAKALFAVRGTTIYPDATSTLRLTYGAVKGWAKAGVEVEPYTRTAGLWQRATPHEPFALAPLWQAARDRLRQDTAFNMVSNHDIIGGNSGSPMVNARGELVGLVFDGNLPSLAGAYWFDDTQNRTVAVASPILYEALAAVYGAERVLAEIRGGPEVAPPTTRTKDRGGR